MEENKKQTKTSAVIHIYIYSFLATWKPTYISKNRVLFLFFLKWGHWKLPCSFSSSSANYCINIHTINLLDFCFSYNSSKQICPEMEITHNLVPQDLNIYAVLFNSALWTSSDLLSHGKSLWRDFFPSSAPSFYKSIESELPACLSQCLPKVKYLKNVEGRY